MKLTTPKTDKYIAAVDSVVRDVLVICRLPPDVLALADSLKMELQRRSLQELRSYTALIRGILTRGGTPRDRCKEIIREVGRPAGQSAFEVGINIGAFDSRMSRLGPEVEGKLPAILARAEKELKALP